MTPEERAKRIVNGRPFQRTEAYKEFLRLHIREAILAERKACSEWMVHSSNCAKWEGVGGFDDRINEDKDCTCGLAERMGGG